MIEASRLLREVLEAGDIVGRDAAGRVVVQIAVSAAGNNEPSGISSTGGSAALKAVMLGLDPSIEAPRGPRVEPEDDSKWMKRRRQTVRQVPPPSPNLRACA
jgi:hypothetical protein